MQTNILEYLEQTASRLPQKLAFSDGTDGLTFSELSALARSVGSSLLRRGVGRHRAVAILMDKHPREIAAFFGCVYAGAFYVPIDPEMPRKRMESILKSVDAPILIADEKREALARELSFGGGVVPFRELAEAPEDAEALRQVRAVQIDTDPIYIVFTSGSTGVPKGVVACHRSVLDYTEALSSALGFSEDTVFANQTPLFFDAPLKELMPVIKFGATAYLVPKICFSFPMMLCDFLNRHHVNTICWVVSALTMISSMGLLQKNPPRELRTIAFGSEVFPLRQYQLWRDAFPEARFFNLYGPTEATGMSCYWEAKRELDDGEPIPVGAPFRNTEVLLISENGQECALGETGEIYLRGTCVTLGYYNNPEKTAEAFVQNPLQSAYPETVYRTGDLAYRNAHGELVFVCRKDAQIKHMGHRIELGEIEAAADISPKVSRSCCVYDAENKKILLYYTGSIAEEVLLSFLRDYLPRYMLPAKCIRLDRMPLMPNGKLDRKALAQKENG